MKITVNRALAPGVVVHNRYQIERVLGAGGFGVTYLVTDLHSNTIAAMKEFIPSWASRDQNGETVIPDPGKEQMYAQFLQRFFEEAQAIYQFKDHPNIVDVLHLFHGNNTAYYVMEYISGVDLKRKVESSGNHLPWSALCPIFEQIVSALDAIHKKKMIHCDISPDNIYIQDNGQAILLDFGAFKSTVNSGYTTSRSSSSIILMKQGFAPPEQMVANGQIGAWTDVYSLAVSIYWAYTGKMPPNANERLQKDLVLWPSELGFAPPSPHWEKTLKKAMDPNPSARYQNVAIFWSHLTEKTETNKRVYMLIGINGYYKGTSIPVTQKYLFGRNPKTCHFCYPINTPGISFQHASIWKEDNMVYVTDLHSSYGTYIRGIRLEPDRAYRLSPGDGLSLGNDKQLFYLTEK